MPEPVVTQPPQEAAAQQAAPAEPKLNKYEIPFVSEDGARFKIPVSAASPDEAAAMVENALKDGTLDLNGYHAESPKRKMKLPFGLGEMATEVDGTPRLEFFQGAFGVSMNPGQEAARQFGSVQMGLSTMLSDVTAFAVDAVDALSPDTVVSQETLDTWRKNVRDKQQATNAALTDSMIATIGAEPSALGVLAGELAPWFVLPATMGTFARTLAYNAVVGGAAGGIMDKDAKNMTERLGSIATGAALNTLAAGFFNAKSGAESYVARRFMRKFDSDIARANQEVEAYMRDKLGDPDWSLSTAQVTADPFFQGLEMTSRGDLFRRLQNKRMEDVAQMWRSKAEEIMSSTSSQEGVVLRLKDTVEEVDREMMRVAGQQYTNSMDDIIENAAQQDLTINIKDYNRKLKELYEEMLDPAMGGNPKAVPAGFKEHMTFVDVRAEPWKAVKVAEGKWAVINKQTGKVEKTFEGRGSNMQANQYNYYMNENFGGKVTADETRRFLEMSRRMAAGELGLAEHAAAGSAKNISMAMKGALLENLSAKGGALGESILQARKAYAESMKKIGEMRHNMLAVLLDNPQSLSQPGVILDALVQRTPTAQATTRELLERVDPALLDDLRGEIIRRAVNNSRDVTKPTSLSEYDPTLMLQQFSGYEKAQGGLGMGLFDNITQRDLVMTTRALRSMKETYSPYFYKDSAGFLEQISINAISRSPEFMGRFVARVISRGKSMEAILQDLGARRSLQELANRGPNSEAGRAALIYLHLVVGKAEAEEAREQRRQEDAALPGGA